MGEKCKFQCQFCEHEFTRVLRSATQEIKCPKCGEYDLELIGVVK